MDQPPSSPKEPRGPVSLRIKFRSASLDQFIERYAVDVSRGGIFIRTREPLAVGTPLRFDFQLQDAAPLLAGEGTVVWIRENDPARAGVTPGMGVRFDKLSPSSQPVLEKILAEKVRREQSGAPSKPGPSGGMAVRRPSSTFSALDPAAARAAATAASGPPRVGGLSPLGAQPRATAPATGSGPLGAQPRTTASASGSGPMRERARTTETAVPAGIPTLESSGAFGRPRTTTGMNAQRPAPAPSSLFEKPTADDIDRALAVLTEVDGPAPAPIPVPMDFSSRVRRPTDAQPVVVEATPDVGDAPKAAHRRPTDAQPMVLESTPDVGDAPSRRMGTRPLFSGTNELKVPTVPVIPIGGPAPGDELVDEELEDDATSAWVGSGPTRIPTTEPELPAAARPPPKPEIPKAAPPAGLSPHAPPPQATSHGRAAAPGPAPQVMAPNFSAPPQKKGSGIAIAIIVVLLVGAAGAGYYVLKGPGRGLLSSTAPTTTTVPEGAATAPAPEGTAPTNAATAVDAGAAVAPTEPEKPAGKPAAIGSGATPSTLRARAAGEAPKTVAGEAEANPSEAKPDEATPGATKSAETKSKSDTNPDDGKAAEAKPADAKPEHGARKVKRRSAAAAEAPPEGAASAAPAVADVSAPAPADAPAPSTGDSAGGKESAKAAGGGHIVKITSSPAGAEVIIDGNSVGTTPYSGGDVDPALPHSITVKKDGYEAYEHMIGGSDWPRPKNGVRTLKLNAKLRSTGGGEATKPAESDTAAPAPGLGTTPASPKRE